MNAQNIFGWSATCLTAGFYISLITPFIKVFKGTLNYDDTPILVILISYVNCITWTIYGEMILSTQIQICNIIGGISTFILSLIYFIYEFRRYILDSIVNILLLIAGTLFCFRFLTRLVKAPEIIGKICSGAKLFVFISPIQLIIRVIREKKFFLIPIFATCVELLSCICWVVYGSLRNDPHVVIPNFIGLIIAVIQACLYIYYKMNYSPLGKSYSLDVVSKPLKRKDYKKKIKIKRKPQKK